MKIITKLHPLTLENKFSHVGISCQVNHQNAFFLIDTGASRSVFDKDKITKYNLQTINTFHDEKVLGIGNTPLEISMVMAKSFILENYEVRNVGFVTLDLSHINDQLISRELFPIDGILGNDFLILTKAVIDYRKFILSMTFTRKISLVLSQL